MALAELALSPMMEGPVPKESVVQLTSFIRGGGGASTMNETLRGLAVPDSGADIFTKGDIHTEQFLASFSAMPKEAWDELPKSVQTMFKEHAPPQDAATLFDQVKGCLDTKKYQEQVVQLAKAALTTTKGEFSSKYVRGQIDQKVNALDTWLAEKAREGKRRKVWVGIGSAVTAIVAPACAPGISVIAADIPNQLNKTQVVDINPSQTAQTPAETKQEGPPSPTIEIPKASATATLVDGSNIEEVLKTLTPEPEYQPAPGEYIINQFSENTKHTAELLLDIRNQIIEFMEKNNGEFPVNGLPGLKGKPGLRGIPGHRYLLGDDPKTNDIEGWYAGVGGWKEEEFYSRFGNYFLKAAPDALGVSSVDELLDNLKKGIKNPAIERCKVIAFAPFLADWNNPKQWALKPNEIFILEPAIDYSTTPPTLTCDWTKTEITEKIRSMLKEKGATQSILTPTKTPTATP